MFKTWRRVVAVVVPRASTPVLLCLTLMCSVTSCSHSETDADSGSVDLAPLDTAVKQTRDTVALLYPAEFPTNWIRLHQPRDSDLPEFFYIRSSCNENTGSMRLDHNDLDFDPGSGDLAKYQLTSFNRSGNTFRLVATMIYKRKVILQDSIVIAPLTENRGVYSWTINSSNYGQPRILDTMYYVPDRLRSLFVEIQDTCSPMRKIDGPMQIEYHRRKLREAGNW